MKKHYIIVEHRNSAAFQRQRDQIADLQLEIANLKSRLRDMEHRYQNEVFYNNALCDLLRENHIKYREVFEYDYRRVKFPV